MPELPEVETTRRGIESHLVGQRIREVRVHNGQLRWPVPKQISQLNGSTIHQLRRRAKYLLLESERGTAIVHLGMSGSLRVVDNHSERRKHDHIELLLNNGVVIRYHDPRRFGAFLWTTDRPETHELLASLGPEPLGNEFNGELLFRKSRNKKLAIKNFLMDNHVVVGVGNIYANEALFMAGIRPGKAARRLTRANSDDLAECVRTVLSRAIEMGGTTLRDFVNSSGEPGYFQQTLNVYGRGGETCKQCDGTIKQKVIGQRSTFYCAVCQR